MRTTDVDNGGAPVDPQYPVERERSLSSPWIALRGPVQLLVLGILALTALGWLERRAEDRQPWSHAIFATDGEPLWDGTLPIYVRELPKENLSTGDRALAEVLDQPEIKAALPQDMPSPFSKIIGIESPEIDWGVILDTGRGPRPGANEAVAGYLAPRDSFTLDGAEIRVVGRIARGVAGLGNAYVIPLDDPASQHFGPDSDAKHGWLDPQGLDRLRADGVAHRQLRGLQLYGGMAPNEAWLTICAIAVLAIMAVAGSVGHVRFFRNVSRGRYPVLEPVMEAMTDWPRLFTAMHVALYGGMFVFMLAALAFPRLNLQIITLIQLTFTNGGLSYVGDAYESSNVLRAAWATFQHNFVVATVLAAILPSLVVPCSGFLLTAIRFCIVGFGMSPILTGSIGHFSYHSMTMVLELEAYIVASFVIVIWPVQLVRGLSTRNFGKEALRGLAIVSSGTVLVGVMLAIAAVYEATTIIAFR